MEHYKEHDTGFTKNQATEELFFISDCSTWNNHEKMSHFGSENKMFHVEHLEFYLVEYYILPYIRLN